MQFLISHPHPVIFVSFSSKVFHVFICKYIRKPCKKAALEDDSKVAGFSFFSFPEQCLGILHVVSVLMIPIFLDV